MADAFMNMFNISKFYDFEIIYNKKSYLKSLYIRVYTIIFLVLFLYTGNTLNMNEQFTHLLEDEWDYIFAKLSDKKKKNILNKLKPYDRADIPSIDEAFNFVLRKGNQGFHCFAKALSDEV